MLSTGEKGGGERERGYFLLLRPSPLLERFGLVLAVITPFTRMSAIKAVRIVPSLPTDTI